MTLAVWSGNDRLQIAGTAGARWIDRVQVWRPRDPDLLVTGDAETAAVLLAGTFDLIGGTTAWPARGARSTPFVGRPMAVFLPPRTEFRAQNGSGEILLVSAKQPAVSEPAPGREAFARKPLLPMAGSGKSYDPNSGEWKPAETFPTAPESLPPRRFERLTVGACTIERVFAPDYKAATLSLDEVVVPAGQSLRLADVPGRPRHDEVLVFLRSEPAARVVVGSDTNEVHGDAAFVVPTPGGASALTIAAAANAPAYVVLAYAGKSGASGS